MPPTTAEQTRRRLLDAAIEVMASDGLTAVSARTVATRAGVAQGLIFYHFGSIADFVAQACVTATRARVDLYRQRFATASTFGDLVGLAADVQEAERAAGNVSVLGQALAAAQTDADIAAAARQALALWREPILEVSQRLLAAGSPLAEVLDPDTFTELVMAAFVGFELTAPVRNVDAAADAMAALATMAGVVDSLGSVGRRAVAVALRRGR